MPTGTGPAACLRTKSFPINDLALLKRRLEATLSTMSPRLGTIPEDFCDQFVFSVSFAAGLGLKCVGRVEVVARVVGLESPLSGRADGGAVS
jgi:hypothetical protein